MNPLFPLDRQEYYNTPHIFTHNTHMSPNPITITHTEYAFTWFFIGILVTLVAALVHHIRKDNK